MLTWGKIYKPLNEIEAKQAESLKFPLTVDIFVGLSVQGDGIAADGSRPLSVADSGRYMQPLSTAAKRQQSVAEKVFRFLLTVQTICFNIVSFCWFLNSVIHVYNVGSLF